MLEGKKAVSACYAIAYGSNGYHLNVWTLPEYRQRGFGIRTGHYFTARSLEKGITPYWLNDLPNFASKKLAEKIGFDYTGDLYPVDIPVHPGPFHIGLARHFQHTLKDPREAVRLYETGFEFLDGNAAQHLDAARAYAIIDERKGMFDHIRAAMEKDPEIKASIKEDPLFKHIYLDDE